MNEVVIPDGNCTDRVVRNCICVDDDDNKNGITDYETTDLVVTPDGNYTDHVVRNCIRVDDDDKENELLIK